MDHKRFEEIKAKVQAAQDQVKLDEAVKSGVFVQICEEAEKINDALRDTLTEEIDWSVGPSPEEYAEWQRIKEIVNADL